MLPGDAAAARVRDLGLDGERRALHLAGVAQRALHA
jgi:hypothetical protein